MGLCVYVRVCARERVLEGGDWRGEGGREPNETDLG